MPNTNSLSLNGTSDYLNDADNYWKPTDFTLECWIKKTALSANSRPISLVNADVDFTTGTNGKIRLEIRHGGGIESIDSTGTYSTGVWTHIATTYKSGTKAYVFYINGADAGSGTSTNTLAYQGLTDYGIQIGARGGPSNYFDGKIDDVRLWSVVRTSGEIAANYQRQLTGTETDLYAYWKLNEGSGTTPQDSTMNNYDLGFVSSPSWSTDVPFIDPEGGAFLLNFI